MNLEEDILIERFINNNLSEIEKAQFMKRMNSDISFREKVLMEKQLFDSLNENNWSFAKNIDNKELIELRSLYNSKEMQQIEESIKKASSSFKKNKRFQIKKWFIYSSAAIIAFLISLSILDSRPKSNQDIYANFIHKTEIPSFVNRNNNEDFKKLYEGQILFEKKDYLKSSIIFSEELKTKNNNANIYIYLSISQMELNQFQAANNTLSSLINSDLIDYEKAYWFKSLLYLKSNQINQCRKMLKLIIKNSYYNKKQAKLLLEEINKL